MVVEQIIRPTGLLDPVITLRPLKGQIDETIELCRQRVERHERVLVTTLTKKTAEDLSEYLQGTGLKVRYIHADIDAVERVEILRQLRAATVDVLVGINLLREGLDLPEVSLVCILDADKEGFLRNETSLIQTAGRAARHLGGECVLFCDVVTDSIQTLLDVTEHRRTRQQEHNETHGITPQSVKRALQQSLHTHEKELEHAENLNRSLVADIGGNLRQAAGHRRTGGGNARGLIAARIRTCSAPARSDRRVETARCRRAKRSPSNIPPAKAPANPSVFLTRQAAAA